MAEPAAPVVFLGCDPVEEVMGIRDWEGATQFSLVTWYLQALCPATWEAKWNPYLNELVV